MMPTANCVAKKGHIMKDVKSSQDKVIKFSSNLAMTSGQLVPLFLGGN